MPVSAEQHYSRSHLYEDIITGLGQMGISKHAITRKELSAVDEFHVRGAEVTRELAAQAGLQKDMKVLDVGCGIGGPCRSLADEYGCDAIGIDITRDYIRTATLLSALTGLEDRTHFIHASALQLPFNNDHFDMIWTQHVQMNIEDKPKMYAEISRVLKPGGRFIYYDVLSIEHRPVRFPVPWADDASISFLATSDELHHLLEDADLHLAAHKDQTEKGIDFLQQVLDRIEKNEMPTVSLRLLIGDNFGEKLGNVHRNLIERNIVLESGIFTKIKK